MRNAGIEELSYILKQAKESNQPKPIFFLGAGASKTGEIPLAGDIVKDILEEYPNNPRIRDLDEAKKDYPNLMGCLMPHERNELLKGYIDDAKINVTHIYLAQLMTNGFVDYVLTVNFDNLMLRALALFNEFPPTYDMAILKDLTTTTFKEKSVVYLHGQHNGQWLLNTKEEMAKVTATVPRIFDRISDKRPWVFIGYSGNDPVFEHLKKLDRFDNGFYWVTYNDNNPNDNVKAFLEKPNRNAFIIKGYDSDSFMLKLNFELGLPRPEIIENPFSSLKDMLDSIVDINDKEHLKVVKEKINIAKGKVDKAIRQFKEVKVKPSKEIQEKHETDLLKEEMIHLIIEENYQAEKIAEIEQKAKNINNREIDSLLADLYFSWGTVLGNLAETKNGQEAENLYNLAFEKYQKALEIKPDLHEALYNWGTGLGSLAETKNGQDAENLYYQAFEKYQKTLEIKPKYHEALYNWGTVLGKLAETKNGQEAENLYNLAFEKYQKTLEIKPDYHEALYNWGTFLGKLAETKNGQEAENLYNQATEKLKKTLVIKPDKHEALCNWRTFLRKLEEIRSTHN